jgi:hypothetical protein
MGKYVTNIFYQAPLMDLPTLFEPLNPPLEAGDIDSDGTPQSKL